MGKVQSEFSFVHQNAVQLFELPNFTTVVIFVSHHSKTTIYVEKKKKEKMNAGTLA